MLVELRENNFDPWQELHQYQSSQPELIGKFGATSIFVGTMRDFNEGNEVSAMTLEHYPKMTQKHLLDISTEALERWDIFDTLIIHRYGEIQPNDAIVLLAVWSAHRADSFSACQYLIEELKARAPFWKKESINEKTRWVQKNTQ